MNTARNTQFIFNRVAEPTSAVRKRPSPITFRLTDDERRELMRMSKGMALSSYIRQCLFGKNAVRRRNPTHRPVQDQQQIARALAMLGASRISNNLNQLAYQANAGSLLVDDDTLQKIDEAYKHVCHLRDTLIAALGLIEEPHA
ncbi:MAG: hypothetical protein KDJ67_11990 [Nitratireductor sp.]|nr:hypothetical protein [Nitratireductor sp.]